MIRRAFKKDRNHNEIVAAFQRCGWEVLDFAAYGFHVDLYVVRGTTHRWVEIKDGEKVPSKRRLTASCQDFKDLLERHGATVHVVETVDDVVRLT